jgi:hypothetical protein
MAAVAFRHPSLNTIRARREDEQDEQNEQYEHLARRGAVGSSRSLVAAAAACFWLAEYAMHHNATERWSAMGNGSR